MGLFIISVLVFICWPQPLSFLLAVACLVWLLLFGGSDG